MAKKPQKPQPTDEEILLEILRFLYDTHRKAGTRSGGRLQINELKRGLRGLGLKPAEITRNLDYLVQNEWVVEETQAYTLTRRGQVFSSKRTTYRISSRGIDLFQGPSQFQAPGSLYGMNIVQTAPGIIQVGSFNFVNSEFLDIFNALDSLGQAVATTDLIPGDEKLATLADIKTMQAQLMKPEPEKTVLRTMWSSIQRAGQIGAFVSFVERIGRLVLPFL